MSSKLFIFISALVGVVTGFFTIHSPLTHSWASIFLWIIVGLIILFFSTDRKTSIYAGAVFGFFNIASWLITGFQGASNQFGGFLIFTLGLSILGALCGALGGYLFSKILKKQ